MSFSSPSWFSILNLKWNYWTYNGSIQKPSFDPACCILNFLLLVFGWLTSGWQSDDATKERLFPRYTHTYTSLSISLSLFICIYIHVHTHTLSLSCLYRFVRGSDSTTSSVCFLFADAKRRGSCLLGYVLFHFIDMTVPPAVVWI